MLNGTFPSQKPGSTANTTQIAAHAMYHFLQTWLTAFPQYNPGTLPNGTDVNPAGVNLFVESYGGVYGPTFSDYFDEMNEKRANGTISKNSSVEIQLESLGIINGCMDFLTTGEYYPRFANNNTYGVEAINLEDALNQISTFHERGGCAEQIRACRTLAAKYDSEGEGDEQNVNDACSDAFTTCIAIENAYIPSNRSYYDIRQMNPEPVPGGKYLEYLSQAQVQASIGARVNFTESNSIVQHAFIGTGDQMRATSVPALAGLLAKGIRVAMIYGDADYICNWLGGEAVSLVIPRDKQITKTYGTAFPAAGYADIIVNSSYVGGAVRQYGNLSFSRIYDAGHLVPYYQPEVAFTVFTRIITGVDIGSGHVVNLTNFGTQGPANSTYINKDAKSAEPTCWIRSIEGSCTSEQKDMLYAGQGTIIGGVLYEDIEEYDAPETTVKAGVPGTPLPTASGTSGMAVDNGGADPSNTLATGVYVATGTPKPSAGGFSAKIDHKDLVLAALLAVGTSGILFL